MLKELVHTCQVRVISVTEGIGSDRAGWEFMATVHGWMHAEYLAVLRAAVLRGQEHAVLEGYSVGDWCLGYGSEPIPGSETGRRGRNAKPRMRYIIREEHAVWIRRIFFWFVTERRPLAWIVRELSLQHAPKDHRSTSARWHRSIVIGILRNRKYIGIWPWGGKTNVRDPLTGDIHQEEVDQADIAQFERELPHLRLIDDETFFKAEALLDYNDAVLATHRGEKGRLKGSTRDASRPRHLLQRMIKCGSVGCGSSFQVGGAHGKYLGCTGYTAGTCQCRTRLNRERAERIILTAVGDQILRNPTWHQKVFEFALSSWQLRQAANPNEKAELESQPRAIDAKISRWLDAIEEGTGEVQEFERRLAERRSEREELRRRLKALEREAVRQPEAPTKEWVAGKLQTLNEVLTAGNPAAAVALRMLLGDITVVEIQPSDRKRKYLQGTAVPNLARVLEHNSSDAQVAAEPMVFNFTDAPPWASIADDVEKLFNQGFKYEVIAERLQVPVSWPAKALDWWYKERNLSAPDGRTVRDCLQSEPEAERIAEKVKVLLDQKLLLHEIAAQLRCCRDTVTQAIRHWYGSRGLPIPDGRTRRKELDRKSASREENTTTPESPPTAG